MRLSNAMRGGYVERRLTTKEGCVFEYRLLMKLDLPEKPNRESYEPTRVVASMLWSAWYPSCHYPV